MMGYQMVDKVLR